MVPATPPRALVVEDDALVRALLMMALEDEGWTVVPADHAPDPAAIADLRPDLLLLDLRLGGSDGGWRLLEAIRATPAVRDVPVVVCTGDRARAEAQTELLDRLADRVLFKPFDLDDLLAAVARPTARMANEADEPALGVRAKRGEEPRGDANRVPT